MGGGGGRTGENSVCEVRKVGELGGNWYKIALPFSLANCKRLIAKEGGGK